MFTRTIAEAAPYCIKSLVRRRPPSAFTHSHRPLKSPLASKSSVQLRHASHDTFAQKARNFGRSQMRQSPFMFPAGVAAALFGVGLFYWAMWQYTKMTINYANYPEKVGVKLRKAQYFTDHQLDPAQAVKAYMDAINLAHEANMHPLNDDVLGIWFELARLLEKVGNIQQTIEVLENTRQKCLLWIDNFGDLPEASADRSRLLQKAVQIGQKIGELYTNRLYADKEKAEQFLVWSVETALKEHQRRQKEGIKADEGFFLDPDQQGAQLETLGHHYEENDNFYFAAQLFLQALELKTATDCHTVMLMNAIGAAMAQQIPLPEPGQPPPSRAQLRDSGRAWVKRSIELAATIRPPLRNEECDMGCVVATHNLGEFAEMDGNIAEARERYEEAGSLAHAISFQEGVISADEGLGRLKHGASKPKSKSWF